MKLKSHKKCRDCISCVNLFDDGYFYCNMKKIDPKYSVLDVTTCRVDPESKPSDCPWDTAGRFIEGLNEEDQIGIRCMAKMFGGESTKDWFEYTPNVQEIVRCKDCKYYKDIYCYNNESGNLSCGERDPNWFCADGKRR